MTDDEIASGILCPVCRRVVNHPKPDPHVAGCPWLELQTRLTTLELRCKDLERQTRELDNRTVGSIVYR